MPQNHLLTLLPIAEYRRLLPRLETVSMKLKQLLYEANQPIEFVYFPNNGVTSLITVMEDGTIIEVGTIGNEGFVGIPVLLGATQTPGRAFMQVAGEAMQMKADDFRQELEKNGAFSRVMHRYVQAFFVQLAQQTACNRLHSIEQRCARWLLMTQDRVGSNEFPLTQEFLSAMLGVRRAGVNEVARSLQERGLIRYRRGIITILDTQMLEATSCECYRIVKAEYDRMLSTPFTQ